MTEIGIRPVVNWPRRVTAGRSYLVTVDVRLTDPAAPWPYDEEEFVVGCLLDGRPVCTVRALGDPGVVLHRFGGSYGPARFVAEFHAGRQFTEAALWLTLTTAGGVPFYTGRLPLTGAPMAESIDAAVATATEILPEPPPVTTVKAEAEEDWRYGRSLVRILKPDGLPAGLGVLVGEREIITSAYVVNIALERPDGSQRRPDRAVYVDFPLVASGVAPRAAIVEVWHPSPADVIAARDFRRLRIIDIAALRLTDDAPAGTEPAQLSLGPPPVYATMRFYGYRDRSSPSDGHWMPAIARGMTGDGLLELYSGPTVKPLLSRTSGTPVYDEVTGHVAGLAALPVDAGRTDRTLFAIGTDALRSFLSQSPPGTDTPAEDEGEDTLSADVSLAGLLGISDPRALDLPARWRPRSERDLFTVPIGIATDAAPVMLDLKEAALGGMGPHGAIFGATASGKSDLLRTIVLGLALTHSPERLNFALVDISGAMFRGLARLPHVAAAITASGAGELDRMRDALTGELARRQEMFREAGNYISLRDYTAAAEAGAPLTPIPTLLVVVDEFADLLTAKPELIDVFLTIARIGRSLGVHLLLASKPREDGWLGRLDTYLSYRICLRTISPAESQAILGVPDASELVQPGNGFLKAGTDMVRFKAPYIRGPAESATRAATTGRAWTGDTLPDLVVAQLAGRGPAARKIWLPPLGQPPTLADLLPPLGDTPRGLTTMNGEAQGSLRAVLGIVDRPFEQRRDPLWADLSGAAGHVAVVGAPRSGKSTLLRTLICSLALLHTPAEVQCYVLDFGGGTLSQLSGLPQVGGIAYQHESARVRRTVAGVAALLERRERSFAENGAGSIADYRRMSASGQIASDGYGDVFLVVGDWLTLRQDYGDLEPAVTALAGRGLGYGIHVAAAAGTWSEFRPGARDLFGTRLELRLGDPDESAAGRVVAASVPLDSPGRGLTRDKHHFLAAVPRLEHPAERAAADSAVATRALVAAVAGAWHGASAPAIPMLPYQLSASELPAAAGSLIPFGVDEHDLAPVYADFAADPHFLIFGDPASGKSNLLRVLTAGIAASYTPEQANVIFIDYRRTLLDAAQIPHRMAHGHLTSTPAAILVLQTDVLQTLRQRLPPPDLTPEQLRARSWWQGPDLFLIVDDYDLVEGADNPLAPFTDLFPIARDIGLHVILARSTPGARRAMSDLVIQRLRDMGSPVLLMSSHPDEGEFPEVRPVPLRPGQGFLVERGTSSRLIQTALADGG